MIQINFSNKDLFYANFGDIFGKLDKEINKTYDKYCYCIDLN